MKGIAARAGRAVVGFFKKLGVIKTIAIVACLAVLLVSGRYLISWLHLPAQAFEDLPQKGLSASLGEIANNAGEVKVVSKDGLTMYVNTKTLDLRLVDDAAGKEFHTLGQSEKLPERALSPLQLQWTAEGGRSGEWDAYTYAIQRGQYSIDKIENGVRFTMTLTPGESYAVSDYLPAKISAKRYQEAFLDQLDQLEEQGYDSKKLAQYRKMLTMFYRYDEEGDFYYVAYSSTPAKSMMLILIDMCKAVEYTQEDVLEDSAEFDLLVEFSNPAQFTVYMENTIDNGTLLVNVPSYEVSCDNDSYYLEDIVVYPAFACAAESNNSGYLFVPDGSGALIEMDTASAAYGDYGRGLYFNTRYGSLYSQPAYGEELHMPVFGLYHTAGDLAGTGFFAVIESGAETAFIRTTLKSKNLATEGGNAYNAVYPQFGLVQSANVKIFGELSTNNARYLVTTDAIPMDCTVRYYLFGEGADYAAFAKTYRDYLAKKTGTTLTFNADPRLYVNLLGAVTVEGSVMGIPYDRTLSLTTYEQALAIYEELADTNAVFHYKWALNGGRTSGWGGYADPIKANGKQAALQQLLAKSSEGREVFLEANLMRVYNTDGWLTKGMHGMIGFNGKPIDLSDNYYPSGVLNLDQSYNNYWLLHPSYLLSTVDRFLNHADWFDCVALTDLGSTYYANYGGDFISGHHTTAQTVLPALEKIAEQKTVSLDNPNADRLGMCDYATNVSRESSGYGTFAASVPFRQLAMNGLTAYTTLNVNMARSSYDYFLLQALELGSIPQFTVSAEGVDELIKAGVSEYYSVKFDDLKADILAFYDTYKVAKQQIGCAEIADHRMLSEKVFETTYANGVKVLVNYNLFAVEAEGDTLDALGYRIVEG